MTKQREMPFLAVTKAPVMVDSKLIRACTDGLQAIRLCIQMSGLSQETVGEQLRIDKGHLTRIMQGRAYFPDAKRKDLMLLCGNYAPVQFDAWALGLELREPSNEARIKELQAEIERLAGAA